MAAYTPQERAYYDQLFSVIDQDASGVLPGQDALPFLVSSGLPQQTLGEIWAVADPENNGYLTKEGWYKAARLIGRMQKGGKSVMDESVSTRPAPYPTFKGQPPPPPQMLSAQNTGQLAPVSTGSGFPPLTPADRAKFTKIFVGCGPSNGVVSGDKARDVFVKSQLSYDKLGQIWNLADTQQRGSLDLPDFIIGMYFIQSAMANPSATLPTSLPAGIYEQASGGRAPPTSPIARQNTGPASPIRAQYTGGQLQPQRTGQSISGQPTAQRGYGSPAQPTRASTLPQQQQWDITPDAKAVSDRFFSQLDPSGKGVIEGDVAVPFMLQSNLDDTTLASIWDLADIRKEGKLTKDEFAVAMHLINGKLAGREVPASLPNSLIPPSLRGEYGGGQQETLQGGASSATKDLFDLFADDPPPPTSTPFQASQTVSSPTPAPPTSAFLPAPPSRKGTAPPPPPPGSRGLSPAPQSTSAFAAAFAPPPQLARSPPSDLLGDDAAAPSAAVPDRSAEIGNMRNQLSTTERSLADAEKQRAELEASARSSAAELEELEQKLSSARVRHEAETKAVSDLRIRVGDQQGKIKSLNTEFITAESDLSAMRSEKDELEQALLRDKEEVRGLQRRMKEVEDEKNGLKAVLERLKKEARQQKGMVTIAKKQLATAENARDGVQAEIKTEEAAAAAAPLSRSKPSHEEGGVDRGLPGAFSPSVLSTAAGVPLPATPRALSPAPTGVSQRSNNPFDRLRGAKSPTPTGSQAETPLEGQQGPGTSAILGAGAVVGAAAGAIAAGASSLFEAAKEAVSPDEPAQVHEIAEHAKESSASGEEEAASAEHSSGVKSVEGPKAVETDPFGMPTGGSTDPFGAPSTSPKQAQSAGFDVDPFGAPSGGAAKNEFDDFDSGFGDSFGAPADQTARSAASVTPLPAGATDFDSAFADFDDHPAPTTGAAPEVDATSPLSEGIPVGIPKSALPNLRPDAERTTSTQAVPPASRPDSPGPPSRDVGSSVPASVAADADDGQSSDEEEGPEDLEAPRKGYHARGDSLEREGAPSPIPPPAPMGDRDITSEPVGMEQPQGEIARLAVPLYPPVTTSVAATGEAEPPHPKTRRSAPPPPASKTSQPPPALDDFDPFGAPATSSPTSAGPPAAAAAAAAPAASSVAASDPWGAPSLPPGAAAPVSSSFPASASHGTSGTNNGFDEDDFDFSDQPPVRMDDSQPTLSTPFGASAGGGGGAGSGFKDDFDFDDEFEKPSTGQGSEGSNGMSKSYEIVSPPPPQHHSAPQGQGQVQGQAYAQSQAQEPSAGDGFSDEDMWGFGGASKAPTGAAGGHNQPSKGFSFDDAFGDEIEPAPAPGASSSTPSGFAPPPGAPPGKSTLSAPPLPQRRDSEAQPDDIEDVKKLCAMGFNRTLVVEALAANSYDFQKTLNILLQ